MLPRHVAAATDESYRVIMQHVYHCIHHPFCVDALKLYTVFKLFCVVDFFVLNSWLLFIRQRRHRSPSLKLEFVLSKAEVGVTLFSWEQAV